MNGWGTQNRNWQSNDNNVLNMDTNDEITEVCNMVNEREAKQRP